MKTLDQPTSGAWPGLKPGAAKRPIRRRVPTGLVVSGLAALTAFVLVAVATKDRSASVQVAVSSRDIQAGQTVSLGDMRLVPLPRSSPIRADLADAALIGERAWVAGQRLAEGTPIPRSALLATAAPAGLRAMSLAVAPEHAAGGEIRPGDRVDVIDVVAGEASHVASAVEVLAVADSGRGGLVRPGASEYFIVVAVDEATSLRLAEAVADGKVDVVRTTGATRG
jgi:Flp pilus assembly protein CpaB